MLIETIHELQELAPMPRMCPEVYADRQWKRRDKAQEHYNEERKAEYERKKKD